MGLLSGKKGLISGALDEQSIAWQVALRAQQEGAEFILTNAPIALRMGQLKKLAEQTNSTIIPADATNMEELGTLFDTVAEKFGKIDFILHAIGMSNNVRKNRAYTDLNYEWYLKTLDVSAISFHKMMQIVYQRELMNEWGSIVGLSYIAAQRMFPKYGDMTEAKAALESIARNFGYYFGKKSKVRVNTVSQSPTPTTAGAGIAGFQEMLQFAEEVAPLGNATAAECADLVVFLFSDLSKKITMQNLYHDGGFSATGMSEDLLARFQS